MIKIQKGATVLQVTNGAFETIYKNMGYVPVSEVESAVKTTKPAVKKDAPEPVQVEEADEVEKPLAQWNKAEVKQYAEDNGIDLTGTKNVAQAKERVQAYMDAQEEANEE